MPVLLLHPEGEYLAERWLRTVRPDAPVLLLAEPGAIEAARRLAVTHSSIGVAGLDDSPEELRSAFERYDPAARIVLPLPIDVDPMEYRFPARLPRLTPYFPLLRRLWLLGFRQFELWSLAGARVLHLPHLLDEFKDTHKRCRCFVVGNGPSLNALDMTKLKNEITLGSNRGYLGFDKWGYAFTYWAVSDKLQIEEYGHEYEERLPSAPVKFFPFDYWPFLELRNGCPVLLDWPREANRQFSAQPPRLFTGYTVTYLLIQIAALMGCNPIILIGVDHRYELKRRYPIRRLIRLSGRWVARHYDQSTLYKAAHAAWLEVFKARRAAGRLKPARLWDAGDAAHPTHFDERYAEGEAKRFLMPRPAEAEQDFACAARWAQENGVRILNASPGSALKAFPAVDFDSLF